MVSPLAFLGLQSTPVAEPTLKPRPSTPGLGSMTSESHVAGWALRLLAVFRKSRPWDLPL